MEPSCRRLLPTTIILRTAPHTTMSRIDAFNPVTPSFDSALHQGRAKEGARTGIGHYGGQQVQVDEVDSMLSEAAEEISMHHAEKAESKHASQRKKEAMLTHQQMSAEAITAYMDATEAHEDRQQLANLAKRILARPNQSSALGGRVTLRESGRNQSSKRVRARAGTDAGSDDDPVEEVKKAYGNATHRILALQYILQMAEREEAPEAPEELLDELREALDDLEMEHGAAAQADINTIATAAQDGRGREEVLGFQATYRDVVLGENSLAATLQLALARFGDGDFAAGLGRLTQALGQDLAAARPSTDPTRLQSLVQDLYHLGVASTVLDGCKELHARISSQHRPLASTPVKLMQELVGISAEKWITGSRFAALSSDFGAHEVQPQIVFLTGVKGLVRDMPTKIFADAEQRQTIFQAVQDALDTAIDREEG